MDVTVAGIVAAVAVIFLLLKMDMRKICGYDIWFDVGFTSMLAWVFMGTYSGMIAALVGGAILSIFLFIMKHSIGYKKFSIPGWRVWKMHWTEYSRLGERV